MDTGSVERAFSTVPPVNGTFSWTAAGSTMTFKPDSPGFQPQTMITVRIGDTARAADSGRTFYAGFESRFRCGGAGSTSPPN
jgi:hypothetical protein